VQKPLLFLTQQIEDGLALPPLPHW
jgi:hypothetical protein